MKPWLKLHRRMIGGKGWRKLDDVGRLGFTELLLISDDRGILPGIERASWALHRPEEWIGDATRQLCAIGWLVPFGDDYLWPKWQEEQETDGARRVREHRERQALLDSMAVTNVTTVTASNRSNQEGELNRDLEVEGELNRDLEVEEETEGTVVPLSPATPATAPKVHPCPHLEIIDAYHRILPELPAVRSWTDARKKLLLARWKEDSGRQDVEAWRKFFTMIRRCPHLMGENERGWTANLPWILKAENFAKILDGNYYKKNGGARQMLGDKASRTAQNARIALGLEEDRDG